MTQKIEEGIFLELVRALYNQHHPNLGQDLKDELLSAAKAIEDKGNLGLAAMRLNRFVIAEIVCHNLGQTAPKELVELSNFLQKAAADYKKWSGLF